MAAIKDRTVCIPIDEDTIKDTLGSLPLPRTPDQACLVAINLKRKTSFKNNHLSEFVNVPKVFKCLDTLKDEGHPEYQFTVETKEEDYQRQFFEKTTDLAEDDDVAANEAEEENVENEATDEKHTQINVLDALEEDEEHSRRNDPTRKDNFEYNRVTCYINDHPEASVPDAEKPVSVAPGEGNI